ncbi:hypothetical protein HPB47_020710 [Ixodes persulcatus]|uniref:Uncharacterized protein n=1 Tax=Ixodes persulcatus TaxID=34615 RepID=A0AC60QEU2_IXOPE|nr:hypothetical protein HPB47_020710 [Ixodes persulcatus]
MAERLLDEPDPIGDLHRVFLELLSRLRLLTTRLCGYLTCSRRSESKPNATFCSRREVPSISLESPILDSCPRLQSVIRGKVSSYHVSGVLLEQRHPQLLVRRAADSGLLQCNARRGATSLGNAGEDVLRPRHQPVCANDAAAVATARHGRSRDVVVRTRKKTSASEAVALHEPREDRLAAEEVFQGGKVGSGRSVESGLKCDGDEDRTGDRPFG